MDAVSVQYNHMVASPNEVTGNVDCAGDLVRGNSSPVTATIRTLACDIRFFVHRQRLHDEFHYYRLPAYSRTFSVGILVVHGRIKR